MRGLLLPPPPGYATGFGLNLAYEKYSKNDYTQHAPRTNSILEVKILVAAEVHHC